MEIKNQSYLRRLNQRAVVDLLSHGGLSYTEIAKSLKLSNTAISKICDELLEKRILLSEPGESSGEKGRPPIMLRINPDAGRVAAIDFSTENTLVCVSDLSGRILGRKTLGRTFVITRGALYETVDAIKALLSADAERQGGAELLTVYIASPGSIDEETGCFTEAYRFENAKTLNLCDFYRRELGCTVRVKNDVKLSIEGELRYGRLSLSTKNALMMYLDAGVGSALMLDGRIYEGNTGSAGEVEKFVTDICDEDASVNLASVLSIPGMVKRLERELKDNPHNPLNDRLEGKDADFALLLEGCAKRDTICMDIIARAARTLSNLIVNLTGFLDIQTVILNGGIIALGQNFLGHVQTLVAKSNPRIEISCSSLKERAAIVGALHLGKILAQNELLRQPDA